VKLTAFVFLVDRVGHYHGITLSTFEFLGITSPECQFHLVFVLFIREEHIPAAKLDRESMISFDDIECGKGYPPPDKKKRLTSCLCLLNPFT